MTGPGSPTRAAALVAALALLAPIAQGDRLERGGDSGSTGRIPGTGPEFLDGTLEWQWSPEPSSATAPEGVEGLARAGPGTRTDFTPPYVVVHGGRVFVSSTAADAPAAGAGISGFLAANETLYRDGLWALDAATGAELWQRGDSRRNELGIKTSAGTEYPLDESWVHFTGGSALLDETRVFTRLDDFVALDPATGETLWSAEVGRGDASKIQGVTGLLLDGETFVATTGQTVYRLNAATGDVVWQRTLLAGGEFLFGTSDHGIDGGRVYLRVNQLEATPSDRYLALDLLTGGVVWDIEPTSAFGILGSNAASSAWGDGFFADGAWDGGVWVVGRTGASLGPPPLDPEEYPAAGERVRVDLAGSRAGAFGPATRYRADWGDGTVTPWQDSTVFEHAYATEGPVEARFTVGNDADQTATTAVAFRVGEEKPNFLSIIDELQREARTNLLDERFDYLPRGTDRATAPDSEARPP